ncbi:MAG: AAA family ATPase [Syntrophobacteraceae bacterium]
MEYVPITINPIYLHTRNERNTQSALDGAKRQRPALIEISYSAGAGKTRMIQVLAANAGDIYLRCETIFGKSGLDLLQALYRETGMLSPPGRKSPCYYAIVDKLRGTDTVVFLDEAQRLSRDLLNVVIDLSDATGCVFVLVGEPELRGLMQADKRCWSRCYQSIQFEPLSMPDVVFYLRESTGINISAEIAAILHKNSNGDFRILRRAVYALVQFANSKRTREIDTELVQTALNLGLSGPARNNRART